MCKKIFGVNLSEPHMSVASNARLQLDCGRHIPQVARHGRLTVLGSEAEKATEGTFTYVCQADF